MSTLWYEEDLEMHKASVKAMEHVRVLKILDGCPDGATTAALHENCGVSAETMHALIKDGTAHAERQHIVALPDLVVIRLRITPAGRRLLEFSQPEKTDERTTDHV